MATGSENGIADVWNVASGDLARVLNVSKNTAIPQVTTVSFNPTGRWLLTSADSGQSSGAQGITSIWDISTGQPVLASPFNGSDGTWDPSGNYVVTTTSSGTAIVWQVTDGHGGHAVTQIVPPSSAEPIGGKSFFGKDVSNPTTGLPAPKLLLTGSPQGNAAVWDSLSGSQVATLAGNAGLVTAAGFSPDGTKVLTYDGDGAARIWDTGSITPTQQPLPPIMRRNNNVVLGSGTTALAADPRQPLRGIRVPATVSTDYKAPRTLVILNEHTGQVLARIGPPTDITNAAFDMAGRYMLAERTDPQSPSFQALPAQIRSVHGGGLLETLRGPQALATGGVLSPDGRLAATIDKHHRITVWSVADGRRLTTFTQHERHVDPNGVVDVSYAFSSRGDLVVSSDDLGWTYVWRAATGGILSHVHGPPQPAVGQFAGFGGAVSPDESLLVTWASWDPGAVVYELGKSRPLLRLISGTAIEDATFGPDSSLIATTSVQGAVSLWDTRSQSPIDTIVGQFGDAVAFATHSGRSLVTDSYGYFQPQTLPCAVCGDFPQLLAEARAHEIRGFTPQEKRLYNIP